MRMSGQVVAVGRAAGNVFKKPVSDAITLVKGLGVEGDAHNGVTVQHIYLKNKDATAPNLRQVHLIQSELFEYLRGKDFDDLCVLVWCPVFPAFRVDVLRV